MKTLAAIRHLNSVDQQTIDRYRRYFDHILSDSLEDQFRRWMFTYASVHTTWRLNCKMYQALESLEWLGSKEELRACIEGSRAGFQNKRTDYIWEFTQFYWQHPGWFRKSKHEDWKQYRSRIREAAKGIGFAKAAFQTELLYPFDAEVLCADTHVLQLYGFTPRQINERGIKASVLSEIEDHWTDGCRERSIPSPVARWIYWDKRTGHSDPSYWAFVFEKENYHDKLAKFAAAQK